MRLTLQSPLFVGNKLTSKQNANDQGLRGAGIAKVQVINGTPSVTQRLGTNGYWWDSKIYPRYGDVAAYRDRLSNFIYAWGGSPSSMTSFVEGGYNYLTRVNAPDAFDLSKYEYYYGPSQGWLKTPHNQFGADVATFWNVGQGQMVYNKFYKCYIFIHLGRFNSVVQSMGY